MEPSLQLKAHISYVVYFTFDGWDCVVFCTFMALSTVLQSYPMDKMVIKERLGAMELSLQLKEFSLH